MSPGIPKDPWGSLTSAAVNPMLKNPFDSLYGQAIKQVSTAAPSKTISITVDQVSNGYIVKVRQNGASIDRIVSDFESLGSEIMAALAEIQLGK